MQPIRHKKDHTTYNDGRFKLQQWKLAVILQLDIALDIEVALVNCIGTL